jgi:hypothetical protein
MILIGMGKDFADTKSEWILKLELSEFNPGSEMINFRLGNSDMFTTSPMPTGILNKSQVIDLRDYLNELLEDQDDEQEQEDADEDY